MGSPVIGAVAVLLVIALVVVYLVTRAREGRPPPHSSQEPPQTFDEPVAYEVPRDGDGTVAGKPRDPAEQYLQGEEQPRP